MPDMPDESIDLIYIDPPFGTQSLWRSNAFKEKVQELQFYDIWGGGVYGYVEFMVERLRHMHRLLKPTGSLFVHLDWRMAHYIKVELDKIFGVKNPAQDQTNFINEIIWCYIDPAGRRNTSYYKKTHDVIFWYAKNRKHYKTNKIATTRLSASTIERYRPYFDHNGQITYQRLKETNPGVFAALKARPDDLNEVWIDLEKGTSEADWWFDITPVKRKGKKQKAKEAVEWPTKKPLALLSRIIETVTEPNDIVADFFCGCGTTVVAAQRLNRQWVGCDAGITACEVTRNALIEYCSLFVPLDMKPLSGKDFRTLPPFEFEKAAVRYIGGVTNHAQVADGGIDGRLAFDGTPIQVKKEDKPSGDTDRFRGFYYPVKQHGRGIYITLNGYTKPAKERAAQWRREGLDVQLLTVDDLLKGNFREQPSS